MAPGVSATLIDRLRRYRAEAFVASGPLAVRALQSDLAAIPVAPTRDGAMRRFHILLVCASVMKRDPANYSRAVGKAYDGLISFLQNGASPTEAKSPPRKSSPPRFQTVVADREAPVAAVVSPLVEFPPTAG